MRFRFGFSTEFHRLSGLNMGARPTTPRVRSIAEPLVEQDFPLDASIGAAVRFTQRAFADDLQAYLQRHRVNVGMWYFLRALWENDGLTQRELSRLIGVSEPTTVQQLKRMQADGLIERRPSKSDRRKVHVHLTRRARILRRKLLPYAIDVNEAAVDGLTASEVAQLQHTLQKIRSNLRRREILRNELRADAV
jgi:DNA-binding MarR family transcriptional regulator